MKNKVVRFKAQKSTFKVTGFIFAWILALVVAVVFTQALRNSVSYIFFIVICAVLPADLLYTLAAYLSVSATFGCSAEKVGKNEAVEFSVTLQNRFILPLPFTEAELILPDTTGFSSSDTYVRVPLSALGKSEYKKSVAFPYKGEYACGVGCVYVSGLLRFFRMKIAVHRSGTVTVLPRRITAPLPNRNINDTASSSSAAVSGTDRAEITEIKEYIPGDPIRNIHWKLSTKVEELMTKHFGAENGLMTCVIADSGAHYELDSGMDIDINEFCDDAVCEICCYVVSAALLEGRKAALVYNDSHRNRTTTERKLFDGISGFEDFLPYYAACSPVKPVSASALLGYCEDGVDNDIIFVTSRLTEDTVTALCEAQAVNRSVTLLLFEPYSKINDPTQLRSTAEAGIRELAAADVIVQKINEKELV